MPAGVAKRLPPCSCAPRGQGRDNRRSPNRSGCGGFQSWGGRNWKFRIARSPAPPAFPRRQDKNPQPRHRRQRFRRALAEHRVRLDLQQIAADVGAAALRQQGDGFVQLGHGISGQRKHQVAADVGEPCLHGHSQRAAALRRGMAAAQAGQAVVPRRLYAQRKAVHTGPAERGQSLGRDGLGVGFERDLRTGHRPGGADETGRLRGRQQRGACRRPK